MRIRQNTRSVRNQPMFTGRGPLPETGDPFGAGFVEPTAPARPANPATEKQINFLKVLFAERGINIEAAGDLSMLTKREASEMISEILETPKVPAPRTPKTAPEVTEGMYRDPETETIFKVQRAIHGSGHLYAKVLVVDGFGQAHFDYAAGAIRKIRPEWKMTLEEAKQFGALYGTCCVCARTLTNEKSIEAGIGPICAEKL